jgi:predicted phosphodiesterase
MKNNKLKVEFDKNTFLHLEDLIKKSDLTPSEIELLLKSKKPKLIGNHHKFDYGTNHLKLGISSDYHIGSKWFNEKSFLKSVEVFNKEKVDAIYCPGDILEGMSGRDGQIYDLDEIGYTAQLKRASELLNLYKQPYFFILGNHDLWARNKANGGLNIGDELEKRVQNSKYLGDMEATISLNDLITLKLSHRGNTAYALSYSGQKIINSLEGGKKPNILINGNLHKSIYMFYRNIHYLEAGCMQNQTEFMAMKGSPAHVGFWILDVCFSKDGVKRFKSEWIPEYN